MQFVNRGEEIAEIEASLRTRQAVLYRLVGRRRIGKTALLAEACRRHRGVYLFAPEGDEARVLAELRRQAGEAGGGDVLPPEGWEGLFRFLERFEGRPVVLDEFQHVLESSATAVSLLQHAWDSRLREGRHKWFLSGSSIGMMRRLTAGTTGALFGRLTHNRRLPPFRFRQVALLYPGRPALEVLERYAVFGGTPHYHAPSVGRDLRTAVVEGFLGDSSPLRDEPLDLLRFELSRPARYNGILEAVGEGRRELEQVRAYLGLRRVGDITRYLAYLRDDLGLLVADEPFGGARRAARYRFEDPFFRFYYRFVSRERPALEVGARDVVWRKIERDLGAHVGTVAEDVLHQLMVDRNGAELKGIEVSFESLGRWWGPTPGDRKRVEEVDAVALGSSEALVGEVRWQGKPVGGELWEDLQRKASLLPLPKKVPRRFIVVSKAGFTRAMRAEAPQGALLLDGAEFLRLAVEKPA